MKRSSKIRTVQYECEDGTVDLGVRQGCFGAWVAVRNKKPIGQVAIRPLQWLPVLPTNS